MLLWGPISLPASPLLVPVKGPAQPSQSFSSPQLFPHISWWLSLGSQVCRPLEYCQVYGWVLPGVWPGRQRWKAFLVPPLLLEERPGPSQLPDQEGSCKTPGESWTVGALPVQTHRATISHSLFWNPVGASIIWRGAPEARKYKGANGVLLVDSL